MSHAVSTLCAQYKNATNLKARKKLAAEVLEANRPRVKAFVRHYVPGRQHWEDGEQVGLLGLLIALERFDPSRPQFNDDAFWGFAYLYVRKEIQKWLGVGVYWQKEPNGGKSAARLKVARDVKRTRRFLSLNIPCRAADGGEILEGEWIDRIPSSS